MGDNAGGVIVTSLLLTGAVAVVRELDSGHVDAVRIGVGLTGAGVALSVMAQFSPQLGSAFAVLMLMGALYKAGPAVLDRAGAGLFGGAYTNPDTPTGGGPKHL